VRLSGQCKCWKWQNKVIVMPTAHSPRKYSSIHNLPSSKLYYWFLESSLQYFPCYTMNEVDHLSVFLSHFAQNMPGWPPQVFLAINMFTLVAVHLFPLYFPGNKLKHPSKCTILRSFKHVIYVAMPHDSHSLCALMYVLTHWV